MYLTKEQILAALNAHYQCGVNVVICAEVPEKLTSMIEGVVYINVVVPTLSQETFLSGEAEKFAWEEAYRKTFGKEPVILH